MAQLLLEKEVINRDDMRELLGPRPFNEIRKLGCATGLRCLPFLSSSPPLYISHHLSLTSSDEYDQFMEAAGQDKNADTDELPPGLRGMNNDDDDDEPRPAPA